MKESAIFEALKSLPPGTLSAAARSVPGEAGRLLSEINTAIGSQDQEKAISTIRALASQLADPTVLDRVVRQARAAASGGLTRVRTELGMYTGVIERFGATQTSLLAAARLLRPEVEGDPILAPEVDALVEQLSEDRMVTESAALLTEIRDLTTELEKALAPSTQPIDPKLGARADRLNARLDGLMKAAKSKDTVLLGRVEDASRKALLSKHPAAGALARLEAGLSERAGLPSRWRKALEAGLLIQDLETAWVAGKKVQTEAISRDDARTAATTAHRVADLADQLARTRPETLRLAWTARLEEALLLRRMPEYQASAQDMVETVLTQARNTEGISAVVHARVLLMAGQFYEQAGEAAMARRLFRQVLDLATPEGSNLSFPAELGRASLGLGRLSVHQPHLAEKSLRMAQQIAEKIGDRFLFTEAVEAQIAFLIGQEQPDQARALAQSVIRKVGGVITDLKPRLSRLVLLD